MRLSNKFTARLVIANKNENYDNKVVGTSEAIRLLNTNMRSWVLTRQTISEEFVLFLLGTISMSCILLYNKGRYSKNPENLR